MLFFKTVLMIGLAVFFSIAEVRAADVMLKIACIEANALDAFRVPRTESSEGTPAVDYSAVAAALSHAVSGAADAGQKASINSRLMPAVVRDIPALLQALYPEQARLVGRKMPDGSNGWHRFIINFSSNAQVAFIELSVEHAVLGSLATGSGGATLQERPIQQYTHGRRPGLDAVFTAGYSFFSQQLAQGNAREWLETIMPLKNGIGVVALRRAGSETRTDTVIIRIDARSLPQSVSGRTEALVVLGWDRL
jgi:hypothetical protein